MKFRIYDDLGNEVAIVQADSQAEALASYPEDYQAGDLQREAGCLNARASIDAAKSKFAAEHGGLSGASNSAITRAWKRAGKPT